MCDRTHYNIVSKENQHFIMIGTNTVKYFQEIDDVSHLPRRSAQLRMGGVTLTLIT